MEDWRKLAACKDMDSYIFFDGYEENRESQLAAYKACSGCPVRLNCLDYAIEHEIEGGFFGGRWFPFKKIRKRELT